MGANKFTLFREVYEEQINSFNSWLHDVESNAAEMQDIEEDDLGNSLQKVYALAQESSEKKPYLRDIETKLTLAVGQNAPQSNFSVVHFNEAKHKFTVSNAH